MSATITRMSDSTDLPIVCTLSPAALAARRDRLLAKLFERAATREPLPAGYRLSFTPSRDTLEVIARTIDAERQCCQFLRFQLTVEPGGRPIVLDVTRTA